MELTYNLSHMEGGRLTRDQTRCIYETNTIDVREESVNVDDILETSNHFRCVDLVIEHAKLPLSEKFIKELHAALKSGTSDSRLAWFAVGSYKKMPNEVGGMETAAPENVGEEMRSLLTEYNRGQKKSCGIRWTSMFALSGFTRSRTATEEWAACSSSRNA